MQLLNKNVYHEFIIDTDSSLEPRMRFLKYINISDFPLEKFFRKK